jgi:site-specific recombinase XerD
MGLATWEIRYHSCHRTVPMLEVLYTTGLRVSELPNQRLGDVNLNQA